MPPAMQSTHVLTVVAARAVENLPCTHSVHGADPDAALNLPAAHLAHGPPSGPVKPLLHKHAVARELPDGEYELAAHPTQLLSDVEPVVVRYLPLPQLLHAADPVELLYLPAAQAPQVPPSAPVKPRLHLQSPAASLPVPE